MGTRSEGFVKNTKEEVQILFKFKCFSNWLLNIILRFFFLLACFISLLSLFVKF